MNRLFINRIRQQKFENQLLLITSALVSFLCILIAIIDVFIGFNTLNITLTFITGILFGTQFIIGFIYNKYKVVKWSVSFCTWFLLNTLWFFNYNSSGPVLLYFLIFFCFIIFIWNKKELTFILPLLLANYLLLLLLELKYPELLIQYEKESIRLIDRYIGLIVSSIIILVFTGYAKRSYINQFRKAKLSDDLKTAFMTNMSHEIRTPLNAIVGFSEIVGNDNIPSEKKSEYVKLIKRNNKYLLQLVNDIMDISIIESNQLKVRYSEFSLPQLMNKLYKDYTAELITRKKDKIELTFNVESNIDSSYSDAARIEQILKQLLDNAIKFTKEGAIQFGVFKHDNNYVFYVEDSGPGIEKKYSEHIFERFTKVANDDSILHRGTGIGLYITKMLVNLLKGNVWFESTLGEGATFYVKIPIINQYKTNSKSPANPTK